MNASLLAELETALDFDVALGNEFELCLAVHGERGLASLLAEFVPEERGELDRLHWVLACLAYFAIFEGVHLQLRI